MKFYFCEGCGKRITDEEIDAGLGRDKKLKGVYCKGCAIGVTTMESLPLTDSEAEKILRTAKPVSSSPPRSSTPAATKLPRSPRRSSGIKLPGHGAAASREPSRKERKRKPDAKSKLSIGLWGVGAVLLLTGIFILTSSTPETARKKVQAKNHSKASSKKTIRRVTQAKPETRQKASTSSVSKAPLENSTTRVSQPESVASRNPSLLPNEHSEKALTEVHTSKPKKLLMEPGKVPVVAEIESDKALPKSLPVDVQLDAKKPIKPAGPSVHELAFEKHLKALIECLKTRDLERAEKVAQAASADSLLGSLKEAAERFPDLVLVFQKHEKEKKASFLKLVGKKVSLKTSKGIRKGKVLSVDGKRLELQQIYKVNGREKSGAIFPIPMASLLPETIQKYFPLKKPASKTEWAAQAMACMANGQLVQAEQALKECAGLNLEKPLRREWTRMQRKRQEANALAKWKRLSETFNSDSSLSEKKVNNLLIQLAEFEKSFADTACVRTRHGQLKAFRERLEGQTRNSKQFLKAHLRGQVVAFDPKSGRAKLYYDFSHPVQLQDFLQEGSEGVEVKGGVTKFNGTSSSRLMFSHFDLQDVVISFTYTSVPGVKKLKPTLVFGTEPPYFLRLGGKNLKLLRPKIKRHLDELGGTVIVVSPSHAKTQTNVAFVISLAEGQLKVAMDGKTVLEAKLDLDPTITRFGFAGASFEIDDLVIEGTPSTAWQSEVFMLGNEKIDRSNKVVTWTNAKGDGRWSEPGNWNPARAPTEGDRVVFSAQARQNCHVSAGLMPSRLQAFRVERGYTGTITFDAGFARDQRQMLNVDGTFSMLSGTLVVAGKVEGKGRSATGKGVTIRCKRFLLGRSAVIHSDGLGFVGYDGPGAVEEPKHEGASHAGRGGLNHVELYGDPRAPATFGCGNSEGRGGGAIKIEVTEGMAFVNGSIRCNGQEDLSKGAAGGSIFIDCDAISGTGFLQANGSKAHYYQHGGGGGGRIAIRARQYRFKGRFECSGGLGGTWPGKAGTVSLPDGVDLEVNTEIGLAPGTSTFGNLIVKKGGKLVCHSDWNPDGNPDTHDGVGCVIKAKRMTIEKGGALSADDEGYPLERGPGASKSAGATHGGRGLGSSLKPYGNPVAPVDLGSGGSWPHENKGTLGYGGGAIRIELGKGELVVDGTLSASVALGRVNRSSFGGAGGSILVRCGEFEGNGKIEAQGGTFTDRDGNITGKVGGGGRIAIHCNKNEFKGTFSVAGGADGKTGSEPGTLFVQK